MTPEQLVGTKDVGADRATIVRLEREQKQRRSRHTHTPWCGDYPPGVLRWWLFAPGVAINGRVVVGHFAMLDELMLGGRVADEMEQLSHCFERVIYGRAADPVHGWPCVCLREAPVSAGDARGSGKSDAFSSFVAIRQDLLVGVQAVPIRWQAARRLWLAVGQRDAYLRRLALAMRGHPTQPQDAEVDPCEGEAWTGRHTCYRAGYERGAMALGWKPKPEEQKEVA